MTASGFLGGGDPSAFVAGLVVGPLLAWTCAYLVLPALHFALGLAVRTRQREEALAHLDALLGEADAVGGIVVPPGAGTAHPPRTRTVHPPRTP